MSVHVTIQGRLVSHGIRCLWYLTHRDNLVSIFQHGILSHSDVERKCLPHERIDWPSIQRLRSRTIDSNGMQICLHDLVPLFLASHQPMLYVQRDQSAVVHLELDLKVLSVAGTVFSDGNAAARNTQFYRDPEDIERLYWDVIPLQNCFSKGYKCKKAAEVLVRSPVSPRYILKVHVRDKIARADCIRKLPSVGTQVKMSRHLYSS
ncbi:MAG: DUF4433 domain-containing protein [Acidobacteria bacterium]|nr:DUF4433 domain-containing protein [Acidobacteriota bacterium]